MQKLFDKLRKKKPFTYKINDEYYLLGCRTCEKRRIDDRKFDEYIQAKERFDSSRSYEDKEPLRKAYKYLMRTAGEEVVGDKELSDFICSLCEDDLTSLEEQVKDMERLYKILYS